MTIKRHIGPADGQQVARAAIAARQHRVPHLRSLVGPAQMGSPIPYYVMRIDQAQQLPADATIAGWRYILIGGIVPGMVDIAARPEGNAFGGLSHGIVPQRVVEAGMMAEQILGNRAEEFEPRLLEVPAAHLLALWLRGPNDYFISLLDGSPPGSAPLKMIDDIRPQLTTAAAAVTARIAPSTGAPTN